MKHRSNFKICLQLIALVKPLSGYMLLAVALGILGNLAAAFVTILGGSVFLNLINSTELFSTGTLIFCIIIFALFRGILRYGEQYCNHFVAFKLLALIRDKIFYALRRLCPAKLEGKEKGNLIAVITSDIELLEVFYAHTISPVIIALIFAAVMCSFIGTFHPLLALIAFAAYFTVGALIPVTASKLNGNIGLKYRTNSGKLSTFLLESLRGLSEIIQYNIGDKRLRRLNKQTELLIQNEKELKRKGAITAATSNAAILFFNMLMLFSAAMLYLNGKISFDAVLLPVITLISSFGPFIALSNLGSGLQNTFAAGSRVLDILDEKPYTEDISGKIHCNFTGAFADNVSFSYGGENILSHFSVELPQNKIIGITGKSGSGKSTFLKLLMRFWNVSGGKINISNRNIQDINTTDLRTMQSYMTQETHLFNDSIYNNLLFVKPDATMEEIKTACKKASIHKFICGLANGYDTQIGELGDTLSGGERQRIGLARIFLHGASLVLLDEPTSNLDNLNEAVILKAIIKESKDKTIVLISHRTSTMRLADKIYSVENGRVS